jgi:GNAT superfamily N-acetyltransferase
MDTRALADGRTLTVRPVRPGEAHLVDEVFARMSPQSRQARFLAPVPRLTPSHRRALADVDHYRHRAWVAHVEDVVAGIGHYVRVPGAPGSAELGIEIADEFQGLGIGTVLVGVILVAALQARVAWLECTVAPGNRRALALTRKLPHATWRWEDGLVVGSAHLCAA